MLPFDDQLYLIEARGLPAAAVHQLVTGERSGEVAALLAEMGDHRRFHPDLKEFGVSIPGEVEWPDRDWTLKLGLRLQRMGARLCWREGEGYPPALSRRMGREAPHWVWLCGPPERLDGLTCAFVGSRRTEPPLLEAARNLAQALAEAGVAIVSGLAEGADRAAHAGALQAFAAGGEGTVAVPARGLLRIPLTTDRESEVGITCLALDRPQDPFSPGLAIRRNSVIAALSRGLVLVASGLRGGSTYAVRWALAHGMPIWCFEAGDATPAGNQSLIRSGHAQPLPILEKPEDWIAHILPTLQSDPTQSESSTSDNLSDQLDWLR